MPCFLEIYTQKTGRLHLRNWMLFYCYKITNLINHKNYIGKTNNIKERWRSHKSRPFNEKDKRYNYPFYNAIRKYSVDNFNFEIIAVCDSWKESGKCETFLIKHYKSNEKLLGYNLTAGGEGTFGLKHTDITRSKMSKSHIGLKHTENTIKKLKRPRPNMVHTEEFKNNTRIRFSGENSNTAKLTWKIVNLIREDYETGNFTHSQLAIKYGISLSNIGSILRNETWRI